MQTKNFHDTCHRFTATTNSPELYSSLKQLLRYLNAFESEGTHHRELQSNHDGPRRPTKPRQLLRNQ
eukprot:370327-Amphidinium_carterae.1